MNMPPSALLGRLQAFLPELEEANLLTEKLAKEGTLEVLDTNLEVADTDQQQREEAEATDEEEEDEEEAGGAAEGDEGAGEGGEGLAPPKTIQLDFALGDFDDTAIAQMENEAEAAEEGLGNEVETAGLDDGEDEEEETGVASLVRLPVATTDAEPRPKPRRPLIEEM